MNLVREFVDQMYSSMIFDDNDIDFEQKSNMVYVDGEEGDYGTVEYYYGPVHPDNLIATKKVYGGDREDVEFTDLGKRRLCQRIIWILSKT